LFDAEFYRRVAPHFPQVNFHVIGCGTVFDAPANVRLYDEMPFRTTLPYLRHADVGLAPYVYSVGADYVAESSLKLAQFEYLGLPAVTAAFAAGGNPNRFGYVLGDTASMIAAMQAALAHVGHVVPRKFLSWDDIARRVLDPRDYPEIRISSGATGAADDRASAPVAA
jgi:2-beta-glucuronyltransferase